MGWGRERQQRAHRHSGKHEDGQAQQHPKPVLQAGGHGSQFHDETKAQIRREKTAQGVGVVGGADGVGVVGLVGDAVAVRTAAARVRGIQACLLYTSDAADD